MCKIQTKRLFDIILSSIGLIGLAILFPFIALAIKLDSSGVVIYSQNRVGRNRRRAQSSMILFAGNDRRVDINPPGRVFKMYKFRSMIAEAEPAGELWAIKNDPRITRVGRIMRSTHIDELPQLWNVLKGDMSLVGPRPERPGITAYLRPRVAFYDTRLTVLPGITGMAQIKQDHDDTIASVQQKVQYDMEYIDDVSVWNDVRILLGTLSKIG